MVFYNRGITPAGGSEQQFIGDDMLIAIKDRLPSEKNRISVRLERFHRHQGLLRDRSCLVEAATVMANQPAVDGLRFGKLPSLKIDGVNFLSDRQESCPPNRITLKNLLNQLTIIIHFIGNSVVAFE